MSLFFYAYFNVKYLFIILISILGNYFLSVLFSKNFSPIWRKILLIVGVAANISILFFYKYYDFFISNINYVFKTDFNLHHLILPLGISFFTFQQLSYVIDSYKKEVPHYNILDYSLFVSFFPQLIAGPIVLHNEIVPQFADNSKRTFNYDNFSKGITAFTMGLAKKVLIADIFGNAVALGFDSISSLNTISAIVVMLSYTFQIYFDFSGYCDMAMGIGKMFNIDIPMNFNSPYKATNISDFWKRWHITLTRFFTRYVYIPLGGNRKGQKRTYLNVFIVFMVSGLWHGANWTFIVWGILHGVATIIHRIWSNKTKYKLSKWVGWIITFLFVNITWVFFRSNSVSEAILFLQKIITPEFTPLHSNIMNVFNVTEIKTTISIFGLSYLVPMLPFVWIILATVGVLLLKNTYEKTDAFQPKISTALTTAILLMWCVVSLSGVTTFLYFNF